MSMSLTIPKLIWVRWKSILGALKGEKNKDRGNMTNRISDISRDAKQEKLVNPLKR
jgi:hypothetical protein